MNRRGFLKGILASGVAPYVVTTAGLLMPCRAIARPIREGFALSGKSETFAVFKEKFVEGQSVCYMINDNQNAESGWGLLVENGDIVELKVTYEFPGVKTGRHSGLIRQPNSLLRR